MNRKDSKADKPYHFPPTPGFCPAPSIVVNIFGLILPHLHVNETVYRESALKSQESK
jgi:hypothetical protein